MANPEESHFRIYTPGNVDRERAAALVWLIIYGEFEKDDGLANTGFDVELNEDGFTVTHLDPKKLARVMSAFTEKRYRDWAPERLAKATKLLLDETLGRI